MSQTTLQILIFAWWKYDMERFVVTPCNDCFDCLLDEAFFVQKTIRASQEDDQGILIKTSSWNQRFVWEPPQPIRDSHYMVLPQTFPYANTLCPTICAKANYSQKNKSWFMTLLLLCLFIQTAHLHVNVESQYKSCSAFHKIMVTFCGE